MNLNNKIFDKFNILETPKIGFDASHYDKETKYIKMKCPRLLDSQLRKYRLQNATNYPEILVESSTGRIMKFTAPKMTAISINYHCNGITLMLYDRGLN